VPFQSDKQRKYLFSEKPEVAKKFVADSKAAGKLVVKKKKLSAKSVSKVKAK
jgi:hypothetical protein